MGRESLAGLLVAVAGLAAAAEPRFELPGNERAAALLAEFQDLHLAGAASRCGLWDAWLPRATLWTSDEQAWRYRQILRERPIDAEGYVSLQQHRGLAHSEGWPFPTWQQAGGQGWHFSIAGDGWASDAVGLTATTSTDGWTITGAEVQGIDPAAGLELELTADEVTIVTPPVRVDAFVSPFLRLEWAGDDLTPTTTASVSWLREGEQAFPAGREVAAAVPGRLAYANIPLSGEPDYTGLITRYRLTIRGGAGGRVRLKSLCTAVDSRHPVTNPLLIIGVADAFCWTGDLDFLRAMLPRLRRAVAFTRRECGLHDGRHAVVAWPGHDGRSGISLSAAGDKTVHPGRGIGNNYWDLLPFGGHDAFATLQLEQAIRRLAKLEAAAAAHPEWEIPSPGPDDLAVAGLMSLADEIRADFQRTFWNDEAGRFVGWIDSEGRAYDYGFTFLNLEAVACGLASDEQAELILDWVDGRRIVAGDTSQGGDIYHWRFGPRSTTRRNVEAYVWSWLDPEAIPWGGQVQDGGAVLGFSLFDILARLRVRGPDDAWRRLEAITRWFAEVQAAGGYRAYYAVPGRGTLQGGGTPGGLGCDMEFLESVLVPHALLEGFLGFTPTPEGCRMTPRLPAAWPAVMVRGIHIQDGIVDVTAGRDGTVALELVRPARRPLVVEVGSARDLLEASRPQFRFPDPVSAPAMP